ncbi:MAG TPA: suppressor of fused domain protein [Thermoanaerobaculia bacterium]|nr:suppressor of fused domain protein [Thermoanaerobaculia bacterium]
MWPFRKRKKPDEDLLERVWTHRETVVYPALFGEPTSENIYTLKAKIFESVFQQKMDLLWGHHGVIWFRSDDVWTAVTSGMSNPWWDDHANPDGPSGMGLELAIQCREEEAWATGLLQRVMAYQLLIGAGCYPNTPWLARYARVPLGGSLSDTSALTHVMMVPRPELMNIQLESGTFDILQVVPITAAELRMAQQEGGAVLLGRLAEANADRVVDLERASVV